MCVCVCACVGVDVGALPSALAVNSRCLYEVHAQAILLTSSFLNVYLIVKKERRIKNGGKDAQSGRTCTGRLSLSSYRYGIDASNCPTLCC